MDVEAQKWIRSIETGLIGRVSHVNGDVVWCIAPHGQGSYRFYLPLVNVETLTDSQQLIMDIKYPHVI